MANEVDDGPRLSVRELIGVWEKRIAVETEAAKPKVIRKKSVVFEDGILFDLTDEIARPRRTTSPPPQQRLPPARSAQTARGRLAQSAAGEARLLLSKIPEPFGWGKKGRNRA